MSSPPTDAASDLEAIRQLKARYFRLMDTKQWAKWEDCFTEDVSAVYEGVPRLSQEDEYERFALSGRRELVAGVMGLLREDVISIHQGFMPELELTGPATATGIWAMYDYLRLPRCTFQGWGHYHEEYAKQGDQWRIAKIHLTRLHTEEVWQSR